MGLAATIIEPGATRSGFILPSLLGPLPLKYRSLPSSSPVEMSLPFTYHEFFETYPPTAIAFLAVAGTVTV